MRGIVQLWDVASGRPIRRFEGTQGKVDRAYFVADGKKVAATSQGDPDVSHVGNRQRQACAAD